MYCASNVLFYTPPIRILPQVMSTLEKLPIIRVPVMMEGRLKTMKRIQERDKTNSKLQNSMKGNLSFPIISCKNAQLNYYKGQVYPKFKEVPLASKGWHNKKSSGDYFTINSYEGNPAFASICGIEASTFSDLGLSEVMVSQIENMGFTVPTNIQILAIPQIIKGTNTLIEAETGNGKTVAFLAPMIEQISSRIKLLNSKLPLNSPLGLIIVPGRELAHQIKDVGSSLGKDLGVNVEVLQGGHSKKLTLYPKMSEPHLLVATFGVLSKLTTARIYNMDFVRHIILDEADSLLDDSFNEHLIHFLKRFPIQGGLDKNGIIEMAGVQLTLVAATTPTSLNKILDPLIEIDSLIRVSTPYLHLIMPHVPQKFYRIQYNTKADILLEMVLRDKAKKIPVLIFSNNSKTCDWASLFLNENGISCTNLNGQMNADLRSGRFEAFQFGKFEALSCTDLTSRGLDTVKVGHVINFDFPQFMADYIHRCGRTGRVGGTKTGLVSSLVNKHREVDLVQKIEYASRMMKILPNVNANIKRIITAHVEKEEENLLKQIQRQT